MKDFNDDSAKYAEMIHEDRELSAQEGRDPVVPEQRIGPIEQDAEPINQAPAQQQQQYQQYDEPVHRVPDQNEDPIGHFDARIAQMENHQVYSAGAMQQELHHQQLLNTVKASEESAQKEYGEDYEAGLAHLEQGRVQELQRLFPDNSAQAKALAFSYGLQSPAHMREAILNRDRQLIVHTALQNNTDPASYAFRLALERGYQPRIGATKSQRAALHGAIKTARGDDFDKLWDGYRHLARYEDSQR